jgi:DNA modification methylase
MAKKIKERDKARTFGQDLMKGENEKLGNNKGGVLHKGETTEWGEWQGGSTAWQGSGTSIFDPVLCEISYQWFCPAGGMIVDPFAGGSVRGIVAKKLGFDYVGIDLRAEQIAANRQQARDIFGADEHPTWVAGNSIEIDKHCKGVDADLIFSCPPYFDLEVYSDDPEDLSTLSWDKFIPQYREIIEKSVALLKENRFAVFVVGDVRDKKGFYRNFTGETVQAFEEAGAMLYNEIVLVNVAGSLPIRVGRQFNAGRKLGKMHQNVYVFYKGDPKQIKEIFGEIDLTNVDEFLTSEEKYNP